MDDVDRRGRGTGGELPLRLFGTVVEKPAWGQVLRRSRHTTGADRSLSSDHPAGAVVQRDRRCAKGTGGVLGRTIDWRVAGPIVFVSHWLGLAIPWCVAHDLLSFSARTSAAELPEGGHRERLAERIQKHPRVGSRQLASHRKPVYRDLRRMRREPVGFAGDSAFEVFCGDQSARTRCDCRRRPAVTPPGHAAQPEAVPLGRSRWRVRNRRAGGSVAEKEHGGSNRDASGQNDSGQSHPAATGAAPGFLDDREQRPRRPRVCRVTWCFRMHANPAPAISGEGRLARLHLALLDPEGHEPSRAAPRAPECQLHGFLVPG